MDGRLASMRRPQQAFSFVFSLLVAVCAVDDFIQFATPAVQRVRILAPLGHKLRRPVERPSVRPRRFFRLRSRLLHRRRARARRALRTCSCASRPERRRARARRLSARPASMMRRVPARRCRHGARRDDRCRHRARRSDARIWRNHPQYAAPRRHVVWTGVHGRARDEEGEET